MVMDGDDVDPCVRKDFKTPCSSESVTAKSPSTSALSLVPANADQVLTPIAFPIVQPQAALVGRPIVALNIPSFA